MLMCAIINWGSDLMIMPAESKDWLEGKRRRMNIEADYVLFSTQYLCPIKLDALTHPISEEEQIELMGNPAHRKPIWDKEDSPKKVKQFKILEHQNVLSINKCKKCGCGITKKQAERTFKTLDLTLCETCEG